MTNKHAERERKLNVKGLEPTFETRTLPRQPFFNVNIENGGRQGIPKSVLDKLPAGKTLKWNESLSTEFISDKLTKRQKKNNWKPNRRWSGLFPGVFRDNQAQISNKSMLMKATRKKGPMPWFFKSRFPVEERRGKRKDTDRPNYFETSFLRSKQTMTFGYTEICCKLSSSTVTSSFWLKELGKSNREIDIFEYTGGRQEGDRGHALDRVHRISVHDFKSRVTGQHEKLNSSITFDRDLSTENFFIAGLLWTDTKLYFFVNDVCVRELDHRNLFDKDCKMHVQIDREVFKWVQLPGKDDTLDDFEVFYIRTWNF